MGSGPLAQPLFYQYKSTREAVRLSCSNASQGMTASGLARAKGELLATILRLLDASSMQRRAPKSGLLPIKLVPSCARPPQPREHRFAIPSPHGTPAEGGGGDRRRPRRSRGTLREAAAGRSSLGRGERRDLPLITIRGTFAPVASGRHHGLMSTRHLSLLASGHQGAGVDRSKTMSPEVPVDPPEARQRGGANGGVLTGSPAENPVMPMTDKISSEDTLSVFTGSAGIRFSSGSAPRPRRPGRWRPGLPLSSGGLLILPPEPLQLPAGRFGAGGGRAQLAPHQAGEPPDLEGHSYGKHRPGHEHPEGLLHRSAGLPIRRVSGIHPGASSPER